MEITAAIAWIVAAFGWAATHLFSDFRERRKEIRSQLDKLYESLYALETAAVEFHTAKSFDEQKNALIRLKLMIFEKQCARLTDILSENDFNRVFVSLRRSMTLRNFDLSEFVQHAYNSEIISEIHLATYDLEEAFEYGFKTKFPSKFPQNLYFWK